MRGVVAAMISTSDFLAIRTREATEIRVKSTSTAARLLLELLLQILVDDFSLILASDSLCEELNNTV